MESSSTLLVDQSAREPLWAATARYGVRPAPDGLALVQDFLNTRAGTATGADLLSNAVDANAWAVAAVHAWTTRRGVTAKPPAMTDYDAAELKSMRDSLDDAIAGRAPEMELRAPTDVRFATTRTGEIHWTPAGHGWRWFNSAITGEILLSQHTKTWRRIKQCRNAECRAAIYDSTWDNRAVWHNRTTCDPSFGSPYPFRDEAAVPLNPST